MPDCRLERASDHVWWFTPDDRTDRPALAAVVGERATVLLEAGASVAHARAFADALAPLAPPPLLAVCLTHWHWDHSFGAAAIDAPLVGHVDTARELAVQAAHDWSDAALDARVADGSEIAFCRDCIRLEIPDRGDLVVRPVDVAITSGITLDLGAVTVRVEHVGGDHAADSCVMHVPEDGLLFLGDALYQRLYAPVPYLVPATITALADRIGGYGARVAIEGHGEELLDAAGLAAILDELRTAAARVEGEGEAALAAAGGDDARELYGFLLEGRRVAAG